MSIAGVMLVGFLAWQAFGSRPRIAVVNSEAILNQYLGIKEARSRYQQQLAVWQAEMDTLRSSLDRQIIDFDSLNVSLSTSEIEAKREQIANNQRAYHNQLETLDNRAKEQEEQLLQGALNQINQFIATYAEEHGYDVVLGNSVTTGTVLYSRQRFDITAELITRLNANYLDGH